MAYQQSTADISFYRKPGTTTYQVWYNQGVTASALTTTALVRNLQHGIPFVIPRACTIDRVAMEITGAGTASSLVRLGIYNDNGSNVPSSLVLDAGTIAGDSATAQSITISQKLNAGLYWMSFVHNSVANITFRSLPVAASNPILGQVSTLGASPYSLLAPAFTYSTLPSTFTTFTNSDMYTSAEACFWIRIASYP